jgi:hypothetical protein
MTPTLPGSRDLHRVRSADQARLAHEERRWVVTDNDGRVYSVVRGVWRVSHTRTHFLTPTDMRSYLSEHVTAILES